MSTWRPDIDVILTDSEDENEAIAKDFKGRESILFVVDANLYNERERFLQALEIIRGALISGLLVNDKELLGVMFANTEHSPVPFEPHCLDYIVVPQNCAVFIPLRQLNKSIVQHYLEFLSTALEDFGKTFGVATRNGGCGNFTSMLRLAINLFDDCRLTLNNKTIVYMTDRATPHPPQSMEYQIALQKASDLEGKEIEFNVIPMVDEFDYEVFYKEFISLVRDVEMDSFIPPDAEHLREILADRKLKQDYLRRSLGHFKFSLGPGLEISAQYYNYFKRREKPRKVKLLRKDNSIVKQKYMTMVRKQDAETMEITEEKRVIATGGWYEINLGDMPIRITQEQVLRVRNLHAPGMMLLGFKPKSELPKNFYYKPCNFMYPDDHAIVGSKRLFCALWQRCLERDKIAICLFMRKRRSIPRYVALVPVEAANQHSDHNLPTLLSGDGFTVVYLPMAKHIRNTDFHDWNSIENSAPAEGVSLFEKIIKKFRIRYTPNVLNDPTVERLQANILALALNIEVDSEGLSTMPDAEMQDKRIAPLLTDFEQLFGTDAEQAKKRPATKAAGAGTAAKVAKTTDDDLKRYEYVEQLIANKTLSSCTVAQLRYILDEHFGKKMPKSATKQALIDCINELSV